MVILVFFVWNYIIFEIKQDNNNFLLVNIYKIAKLNIFSYIIILIII